MLPGTDPERSVAAICRGAFNAKGWIMIHHASRFSGGARFLVAVIVAGLMSAPIVRAADTPGVSQSDQLQFQQKYIQAQMDELQKRMYSLASLTRDAEPDEAARLLTAVRRSQELLIIEQMKQAIELLSSSDFNRANTEQEQIITKLEELKKLLTSSAMDLQLLLQRLKALNEAMAKLDQATKEEKRQQTKSDQMADQQKQSKPLDNEAVKNAQQEQQQTRKATESIAEAVRGMGGQAAAAGANLGSAAQAMALAEGSLGSGKPGSASGSQGQALTGMSEAKKKLAAERERILMELERMVRKQVVMNLTEMLERQKSVRGGTEHVVNAMDLASRETIVRMKQLGSSETSIVRIAEQTISLIEETGFSVALPPALKRVQAKVAYIAATLNDSRASTVLIAKEVEVEKDLKDLLDTFKELSASKVTDGNCNCKGDKNKLVAELKVVRLMQDRVNQDTVAVDGTRGANIPAYQLPADIDPMLRDKIVGLRDGQSEVRDAMKKIQDQLSAPDAPAEGQAQ